MDNSEKLLNKYGKEINVGIKSYNEILEFIKTKGKIEQISKNEILKSVFGEMIYNIEIQDDSSSVDIIEYLRCPEKFINSNNYDFIVYKFPVSKENEEFYKKYKILYNEFYDFIYIVFELKNNKFDCNCTKLKMELNVFKGIRRYDYENRTEQLYHYLATMEFLEKGLY